MITLALDTSTNRGGIAVLKDREVLAKKIWEREKSHSELLTTFVADCLRESKLEFADINQISVGKGPGSFTGIRIAINAARTLGYALNIPVFSFDTNEILAAAVPVNQTPLITFVNAHKNLLYVAVFKSSGSWWQKISGPDAWTLEQIDAAISIPHICIGDGYREFEEVLPKSLSAKLIRDPQFSDFPSPEVLGNMPSLLKTSPLDWNAVQALYIRASEAEEKLREGRSKD